MSALTHDAPPAPPSAAGNMSRWLIPVLVVAFASHAFVFSFPPLVEPSNDEKEYLALGVSFSDHGKLRLPSSDYAKRMPLYPAMIAAIDRRQGRELLPSGVALIQTCLAAASTLMIAVIARRIAGPSAGLVAGLIAALYAPYRHLQSVVLCETLVVTLLLAALLLYLLSLETPRTGARWSLLAGTSALLGLALLTRADAGVFVIPFAVHAAGRAGPSGHRAMRAGILLLGVALAAFGWSYRNSRVVGAWTLSTTGGLNFYLGNNPGYATHPGMDQSDYGAFDRLRREEGLSEIQADARLFAMGRAFVADHPVESLVNVLRKIRVWLGSSITGSAPGTLLIVAWAIAIATRASAFRRWTLIAAALISLVWLALFWQTSRPWTEPMFVVPLGLISLFVFNDRLKVRWLLAGLFTAQLAVAIVFIPLERLRWTVDGLLIIALAAAAQRVCDHFSQCARSEPRPSGSAE